MQFRTSIQRPLASREVLAISDSESQSAGNHFTHGYFKTFLELTIIF